MLPISSLIDLNKKKLLAACHKETQTTTKKLKDKGTHTNTKNINTSEKGSLKVIEFSKLIQDPKRPTKIFIIKEIFAEEIHDHTSPSGSSHDAKANRYRYCREVIKPYLKDYPKDCPVSDDQLIRDALEAAQVDFPDYEPCFEAFKSSHKDDNNKENAQEDGSSSGSLKLKGSDKPKAESSKQIKITPKPGISPKDIEYLPKSPPIRFQSSNSNTILKMDSDKDFPPAAPEIRDQRCPKKSNSPSSVEPCIDEKYAPPGPLAMCQNTSQQGETSTCKNTALVESCPGKPIAPKKERTCESPKTDMRESSRKSIFKRSSSKASSTGEQKKTMIEAHSEKIASIKSTIEGFFGKVYKNTKEAVTVLKTESAKHLGRMTAKKSTSNTDLMSRQVHEHKSTETITNFNFFKSSDNHDTDSQNAETEDIEDNFKPSQTISKIFAKVDSTLSILSEQVNLQKIASIIKFDASDKSSPYDNVGPVNDEPDSTLTSLQNSVFTAIKSRFVSMFGESESEPKEVPIEYSNHKTNASGSKSEASMKSNKK